MSKFEGLKLRILQAILSNDEEAFRAILEPRHQRTNSDTKRLKKVLYDQHRFTPMGEPFDSQMLAILQWMLLNSPPAITPSSYPESERPPSRQLLDACLKSYRGNLIHIAAALNRASIIETLLDTLRDLGLLAFAKRQVECRDSEGNTALALAVMGQCEDAAVTLCVQTFFLVFTPASLGIVQDAVSRSTSHLPRLPHISNTVSALVKEAAEFWPEECQTLASQHASYYWPIVRSDLPLLQAQVRRGRLMTKKDDLPALHFAVLYYTGLKLDNRRRELMSYLITCPDGFREERKVSINDIHKLTLTKDVQLLGSAAHFALYEIAAFYRQRVAHNNNAHTFKAEGSRPDREKDAVPEVSIRRRENCMDMLDFLQEHGADFSLMTPAGLTGLDILPADCDQQIIDKVRALMQPPPPPTTPTTPPPSPAV